MQAVQIHQWGGSEVIHIEAVERPTIAAAEVLIRVHAASINPVDWKIRQGYLQNYLKLPLILGRDMAGEVVEVGNAVTTLKVGDAVYGSIVATFAEFVAAKATDIARKPTTLDYVHAATVPVGALTSWRGLIDDGKLTAGQTVLIHGAAGGVGMFAVQIAKAHGATVIGTASGKNEQFVRDMGADQFIDYTTTKFEDVVKNVDIVFDGVGGETGQRSYQVIKPGGVYITVVGQHSDEKAATHGVRAITSGNRPGTAALEAIAALIDAGKIKVHVNKTYPFAEVAAALDDNQQGHARGKIALSIIS